ncbi:MAG: threonine/serine dehydratase [Geminicoccaceae bacterium]|nr:threonine/serine dehydratase [Geminicoccaceae bacterium]MCB9942966.1 threonine/serine dehydratase [Geminicoccaceae bacterium]
MLPVTFDDVLDAAARLEGQAVVTPLLEDPFLNERAGGRLLVKAEPLQRTGSFKFRGAFNRISTVAEPSVVAFSSGNHAQGVALAARLLGKTATIIMPSDAPRIKQENTRAYGAGLRTYDRYHEVREAIGEDISRETGAVLVKPYDDPHVIAGQGTVGLEMARQARDLGVEPDAAIVCAGGGGLTAGCAIALTHAFPDIAVHTSEPAGYDDHRRSLESGHREKVDGSAHSICDALLAPMPGELTFAINSRLVRSGYAVSDDEVRMAMRLAFDRLKVVVEPGGAVALAAALSGRHDCRGRVTLVVLSGGNVDPDLYRTCLVEQSC